MTTFADRLLRWFDSHGRHDLPWQHPREAYRVWLSEIMLQQTQVATVIPYFNRFVERFADIDALAAASTDDVLAHWAGLGYYARARNLHRCARVIAAEHGGRFPRTAEALAELPGIGRSTAAAIAAQAFGERAAILDGNVRRVLARYYRVDGWPGAPAVQQRMWPQAEALLPENRMADYTQALMDLGATLCTARNPACADCPVAADCQAHLAGVVDRYPQPRPRRERPQRCARLLLAYDADGRLLLERRPPAGIWGSLWCPPLIDDARLETPRWSEAMRFEADPTPALPSVRHAFTHFDLELQPVTGRIELDAGVAEDPALRWVTLSELDALGLPSPVRKILSRHQAPNPP